MDKIRELKQKNTSPDLLLQARNVPLDSMAAAGAASSSARAPRTSCAQRLALLRGGSQSRQAPRAPRSSSPRRQLPPGSLLLALGWNCVLAMTPHLSLPHPHAAACPAHRLRPSAALALAPPCSNLASSPLARPPPAAAAAAGASQRCFFACGCHIFVLRAKLLPADVECSESIRGGPQIKERVLSRCRESEFRASEILDAGGGVILFMS